MKMVTVLSIAGSDPGGGAGIQQDLKVFTVLGAYGGAVITALTAQNTLGVRGVLPVEPGFVEAQLCAVLEDIPFAGIKVGMLANAAVARAVAGTLKAMKGDAVLVVDPVMVSKNGTALLDDEGVRVSAELLFPLADVITPNIPEAERLLGRRIGTLHHMREAAEELYRSLFPDVSRETSNRPRAVILKGGHLDSAGPTDVIAWNQGLLEIPGERLPAPQTHGTGCTFSSALAVFLARGEAIPDAARKAKAFVTAAIMHAVPVGKGIGTANPMALISGRIPE